MENFISTEQVAKRLGVSAKWVKRHMLELRANGLKQIPLGSNSHLIRFSENSLNRMMRRASEDEQPFLKIMRQEALAGEGITGY